MIRPENYVLYSKHVKRRLPLSYNNPVGNEMTFDVVDTLRSLSWLYVSMNLAWLLFHSCEHSAVLMIDPIVY